MGRAGGWTTVSSLLFFTTTESVSFRCEIENIGGGEERIGVSLEIILRDLTRKVEVRIEIGMMKMRNYVG